jgi:predicted phage-related endonuclease
MEKTLNQLAEYIRMKEEIEAEIDALKDEIKAYMQESGQDTIIGLQHKATWKPVKSNRFDSAALKADAPELYQAYVKTGESMRFTFA